MTEEESTPKSITIDQEPKPCWFFNQANNCRDGQACPFSHDNTMEARLLYQQRRTARRKHQHYKQKQKKKSLLYEQSVLKEEEIPPESEPTPILQLPPPPPLEILLCGLDLSQHCYYFISGSCEKGPYCPFLHQQLLSVPCKIR